jgi:hypothetical protein
MPKRSSKSKKEDLNEMASRIVGHIVSRNDPDAPPPTKNPAAVELGRRGGLKGGKARAESLTAKRRSEIARGAAEKRWQKNGDR